jgi:hypothetical protein
MRALSPVDILAIWDRGDRGDPVERALLVLSAVDPGTELAELAAFSIGERDRRLFAIREHTFGPEINARTACPHCGERVEFTLRRPTPDAADTAALTTEIDGIAIRFRRVTSADLRAVGHHGDAEEAALALARRCVEEARIGETAIDTLPPSVLAGLSERLSAADPDAEILLDLTCPACAGRWTAMFDIAAFLCSEIAVEAHRLMHQVHRLARAYGWREADILAMSRMRRQAYLEYCA